MFRHLYCLNLTRSVINEISRLARTFVELITHYSPEYSKRLKIHILLHLADDLRQFGPQKVFNTERYSAVNYRILVHVLIYNTYNFRFESFNSLLRNQNVFSNRESPSKDIGTNFAVLEHLRFLCSGGKFEDSNSLYF